MSKEGQQQHITSIGGQAVMEGVMMRGPFKTAVAVRKPDGDIECKVEENGTKTRKKVLENCLIIRGCVSFSRQPCYRNESTYVQCGICRY